MAVSRGRRVLRWLGAGVVGLAAVVAVAGVWARSRVAASLPLLDGELAVVGPAAAVLIDRDGLGVPTVTGGSHTDTAFGLGFLHGQERFFQMDLLRRRAAGELAELFGAVAVDADRAVRRHGFRRVAEQVVERAATEERALIEAYAAGVNAGLAALGEVPFEYLLLRSEPRPWAVTDTPLVVLSMYLVLQDDDGAAERSLGLMRRLLPAELVAFLVSPGTEWDAPVQGDPFLTPPVPGPGVFDLRNAAVPAHAAARAPLPEQVAAGSNNWVVAGSRTGDGAALVANDPHLPLGIPNVWYRASLAWPDAAGNRHRVTGVTLPGAPVVILGSNGSVAWGFTNSQGDWGDVVLLDSPPGDAASYRTPDGLRQLEHRAETIRVKGGDDVIVDVPWTIWGPLLETGSEGRLAAYRWVAHSPEATSLALAGLATTTTVTECLAVAARGGLPAQNIVCGDAQGHIGWTLTGAIPRRVGFDGRVPTSWADGTCGWDGWLAATELPRVVDPPEGLIWTANARVVSGAELQLIGDGGYDLGARAAQIRDRLRALGTATEADMLAVQLDDEALFLLRWRDLLLQLLTSEATASSPQREELRRLVTESWDGHASVSSVGYLLVREFRREVAGATFEPIVAGCKEAWDGFSYFGVTRQYEGPLWRVVSERPPHLLAPGFATWDDALLASADAVVARLTADGTPLVEHNWGTRNTVRMRHPLSRAVPWLSNWLDIRAAALPGDSNMPRVQTPSFGASERTVVAPGREGRGVLHMPGGQSGHPLSPFYRAGHQAWERGDPTPFLPGPTEHTLTLVPARESGAPARS